MIPACELRDTKKKKKIFNPKQMGKVKSTKKSMYFISERLEIK